jgi:hypothetical protein
MKVPDLNPRQLLPAMLKHEKGVVGPNQVIPYLEFLIQTTQTDSTLQNYLVHLYILQGKEKAEAKIISLLQSQEENTTFDLKHMLKACLDANVTGACIRIYCLLKLPEEALELALTVYCFHLDGRH